MTVTGRREPPPPFQCLVQTPLTLTTRPPLASVKVDELVIFVSLTFVTVVSVWLEMSAVGANETSCHVILSPFQPVAKERP